MKVVNIFILCFMTFSLTLGENSIDTDSSKAIEIKTPTNHQNTIGSTPNESSTLNTVEDEENIISTNTIEVSTLDNESSDVIKPNSDANNIDNNSSYLKDVNAVTLDNKDYTLIVLIFTALFILASSIITFLEYRLRFVPLIDFNLNNSTNGLHVFLELINVTRTDALALVCLKLIVDGNEVGILNDAYTGKESWIVPAHHKPVGHIDLSQLVAISSANNIELEISMCYKAWSRKKLKLSGKKYQALTKRWDFNKTHMSLIPVITMADKVDFEF